MTSRLASGLVLCTGLGLSPGFVWSDDPGAAPALVLAAAPAREIAITFDDLPAVSVARGDTASLAVFTDRLLLNFTIHQAPVVGFVNEGKLTVPGEGLEDPAYASPDASVGPWGISWLHHWEQAMGRPRTGAPDPPAWVSEAHEKGRK